MKKQNSKVMTIVTLINSTLQSELELQKSFFIVVCTMQLGAIALLSFNKFQIHKLQLALRENNQGTISTKLFCRFLYADLNANFSWLKSCTFSSFFFSFENVAPQAMNPIPDP